ncbi:helix-turn-helix domain-containing protein [uncultured Hoeflea sp.]|uniref:MerR family transcriptional regulator n=1 Tax=uncultured Hoeflea sp. TaxID=538666 RepID=UPI0030DA1EB9|tara:strand:- start:782 stop:1192 length:411 start_codon:yes stop_codon:yes gene_type:complete
MFSIGELSKRTGVKIPTIRYYEQMGLIEAPERSEGNQRRYSKDGLKRLSFIRHSRELGFSIDNIKGLLELSQHPEKPCHDAHNMAARRLQDVQARIAKLQRLERELKRISECEANTISHCAVIETLADHSLCEGEH